MAGLNKKRGLYRTSKKEKEREREGGENAWERKRDRGVRVTEI